MPMPTISKGSGPIILDKGSAITIVASAGASGSISIPGEAVAQSVTSGTKYSYGPFSARREVIIALTNGTAEVTIGSVASAAFTDAEVQSLQAVVSGAGIPRAVSDTLGMSITVLGDSTGNETTEWVYLLTNWLATKYPAYGIRYRLWDDATQEYSAASLIRTGPSGERSLRLAGVQGRYWQSAEVANITGDLDLRIRCSLDDWTPAAQQVLMSRFTSTGNKRCFRWYIAAGGALYFNWSADGTTEISKTVAAPGFADGSTQWLRVTLDVDNGASGNTVTFYQSADGVTWTAIGSPLVTAGTTSVYNTTQHWEVGSRSSAGNYAGTGEPLIGNVYEVEIRQGINGPIISPQGVDSLRYVDPDSGNYLAGSPIIEINNGSKSGATLTYLSDATRNPLMHRLTPSGLTFVSCSHNDGYLLNGELYTAHDALLALIRARSVYGRVVYLTQNPRKAPATNVQQHEQRVYQIARWALRNGCQVVDTYARLMAQGDPYSYVDADGIHVTRPAGAQLMADCVADAQIW